MALESRTTVSRAAARKGGGAGHRRGDAWWALLFLAPSLIGILVFVVGPILMSVVISMSDWRLASRLSVESLRDSWVGLDNYVSLLSWREAVWSPLLGLAWRLPALLVLIGGLALAMRRRAVSVVSGLGLIVLGLVLVGGFAGLAIDWNDRRFWQSMGNTLYF